VILAAVEINNILSQRKDLLRSSPGPSPPGMTDKVRRALATARATVGTAVADDNAD
jgi:hypothetical protein